MLQAMRSKAAGIVVKFLFSILVLAFAVWGIGDYSFLRKSDPTAVEIGNVKVPASQLDQQYRTELDRLRRTLGQIDPETARQFGLMDQVIQRIVYRTLLDKAAKDLGVRLGDEVVRSRVLADPQLQGPNGQFDRDRFQQILYQNNLTEGGFITMYRDDFTRALVTEALSGGARAPDAVVDRLYRYRNERRGGEAVFVPQASFPDVGKPTDADLKTVYDENKDSFTAPEYRALTVVRVSPQDLMSQVKVTDQQVEDEYRARLPTLGKPEKREVQQLLFADEAAAKAAYDKLKGGADFDTVAKDNKQTADQTNLGLVTRQDLVTQLADPVFALPQGGFTPPVQSPFGWHILKVSKIEAGQQPSLAEVRDQMANEVKLRLAGDAAYDASNKLEDTVNAGATLDEAAAKIGLTPVKVAAVDVHGNAPDGKPAPILEGANDALATAFDTPEGSDTQLLEGRKDTWFMIHVGGVTPGALKPLDTVREQVVALWITKKQSEAARARADEILKSVQGGKTLEQAASPFKLALSTVQPAARDAGFRPGAAASPEITARLFSLKPNEAAVVPGRDGYNVVRLTQIVAADPTSDAAGIEQVRTQLRQQIGGDVVATYVEALRARYGVTIDQQVVNQITGAAS
ncbi:MAG: peptidyl-prolyl cis-trans isomerase [Alphaproteobacteria bacterium]|nr:peptidyl-prolyl cis-trans isomerase [Alphaproteobacteria bacterium]